jgi:outer membrane protein assembly factor BamB
MFGRSFVTPRGLTLSLLFAITIDASDWPQWHGLLRDRHTDDPTALQVKSLPEDWTPTWRKTVGPGHSSPVVNRGTLVFLDETNDRTVAHALEAESGTEIWQTPIGAHFEDEWGTGPRCTPFIDEDRIYAQSSQGEFHCLDLKTGESRWSLDFVRDLGARFIGARPGSGAAPRRGYNGSGLVEGQTVVLPVGSTQATLVCCDKLTGEERWRAGTDEVAYSSIVTADLGGTRQVVAFTADALMGARTTDGQVLWRVPLRTAAQRNVATPVIARDLVIVNSHTFGMIAIRIAANDNGCSATQAWRNPDLKVNLSTSALVGSHLYVIGADKDFVCVDARDGTVAWTQPNLLGPGRRDYGATIALAGRLLVLTDDGLLRLLEANPLRYVELGQTQVCGLTWTFPAIADGRLFVRDGRQLTCFALDRD